MSISVALVDYGAGNLLSITQALTLLGAEVHPAARASDVDRPDLVVVPGVGAQGPAMRRLRRAGLTGALERAVAGGAWYLGICLGMQLLFERSEEDGSDGLGWIAGGTRPIPEAPRLPHVGWNEIEALSPHPLLRGLPQHVPFYFVHSYAPVPADPGVAVATTQHGGRFVSAVASGRLLGVQFHPEKSGHDGLRVLANVLAMVAGDGRGSASGLPGRGAAGLAGAGTRADPGCRRPAVDPEEAD